MGIIPFIDFGNLQASFFKKTVKNVVGLPQLLLQVSSQQSCSFREIRQINNKLLLASIYDIANNKGSGWSRCAQLCQKKIVAVMTGIPVQKIDQKII